jgi:hypothetical protein
MLHVGLALSPVENSRGFTPWAAARRIPRHALKTRADARYGLEGQNAPNSSPRRAQPTPAVSARSA